VLKHILNKIRLISNARKEPYLLFYQLLGFYPANVDIYLLALRHKSASITTTDGQKMSNERLEFLGDAVLSSVITDILYHHFSDSTEGFLTDTRSKIINRESLNQIAIQLGLNNHIQARKQSNFKANSNIYGNALEAIMGAIYLDLGYRQCKKFVEKKLLCYIDLEELSIQELNYKSKLIEWCQKNKYTIDFDLIDEVKAKANQHTFTTQLSINGKVIASSQGDSKKESHQNVARMAYHQLESNPNFIQLDNQVENPDSEDARNES
jgi:ribonuclease-3